MSDSVPTAEHLTLQNRALLDLALERDRILVADPQFLVPLLRPCTVRVLLVTDGGLDFSVGDFGLRTFVETLLSMPGPYVRFRITVAHINNVSNAAVMVGHPGIHASIKSFRFDDPAHFSTSMYDQVWLFGIATSWSRGTSPGGQPYPSNRLSDAELALLSTFMNGGGGLFATGDHGALGRALGGSVPRARSMRLWDDTSLSNATNEVSMSGPRRNDTNRIGGSVGSQFNDQSDDVPQPIQPKMYSTWFGWWAPRYPHPLLCGPNGIIRVLPDHPHEGECVQPANPNLSATFGTTTITEYPAGVGGPRPLPEIIARSTVLSGTTSGGKQATQTQSFGAICAYDGHRAGVGRVVTDATWHHYVNVNLVGDSGAPAADPKRLGFLATPAGQAHLENIKAYYRNIAVWMARPSLISCMNRRLSWGLLWHHRVLEAVMTHTDVSFDKVSVTLLYEIGRHARDVLGNYAGHCQTRRLALALLEPHFSADVVRRLDPWSPLPEKEDEILREEALEDAIPWSNPEPVLDLVLGGALVALREQFPEATAEIADRAEKSLDEVLARGAKIAVDLSLQSLGASSDRFSSTLFGGRTA